MARHSGTASTVIGRLAIAALVVFAAAAGLIGTGVIAIPNHLNPFTPLRIADEVSWLTRMKLSRLERKGAQCLATLAESPLMHEPLPDQRTGEACGFFNAVRVTKSSVAFSRDFAATCRLAVAWALLERHVLHPAAERHLGQDLVRVNHLGTYACRNIDRREDGRRSEHATANAIDISGFVLADGQHVTLERDWAGDDPRRAAFLRAVRDGACRLFEVVLSPDYDEAHRDHFHFDMGSHRACR